MNLFKRCHCADPAKCSHPYWFLFRLRRQRYEESTRTAQRQLALNIAHKRRTAALEAREGSDPSNRSACRTTSRPTWRIRRKQTARATRIGRCSRASWRLRAIGS